MANDDPPLTGKALDILGISQNPDEGQEVRHCDQCKALFQSQRAYLRHIRYSEAHTTARPFQCSHCQKTFKRNDDRKRHERKLTCRPLPGELASKSSVPTKREISTLHSDDTASQKRLRASPHENLDFNGFNFAEALGNLIHGSNQHDPVPGREPHEYGLPFEYTSIAADMHFGVALGHPKVDSLSIERTEYSDKIQGVAGYMEFDSIGLVCTPELSRGNSSSSSQSSIEQSPEISTTTAVATSKASSNPRQSNDSNDASAMKKFVHKHYAARLKGVAKKCTICKVPFEANPSELREHLYRHLAEQRREYVCEDCDIGFVHKTDFDGHRLSSQRGHCGFFFMHEIACTGHHPMTVEDESTTSRQDRFKLLTLLRAWELHQLQLHEISVEQLAKTQTGRLSQHSACEVKYLRRVSKMSLVQSLRTFRSEPHDVNIFSEESIDDLEKKLGNISISKPSRLIRQGAQKIKELRLANENLRRAASSGDFDSVVSLLDRGANVDALGKGMRFLYSSNLTPLMVAAENGHKVVVLLLLHRGAAINASDDNGETALHKASKAGHMDVVRILLAKRVQLDKVDNDSQTALHKSILNDHVDVTRLILNEMSTSATFSNTFTSQTSILIHLAVHHNCLATTQALLDAGADANAVLTMKDLGKHPAFGELLGITEDKFRIEMSVLFRAATLGLTAMANILLTGGASPLYSVVRANAFEFRSTTPFGVAIESRDAKMVSTFLLHGTSPLRSHFVAEHSAFWSAARLGADDILELIFEHYSKSSSLGGGITEALISAARAGQLETLQITLPHARRAMVARYPFSRPIFLPNEADHLILEYGVDNGEKIKTFGSPIYHAAAGGHTHIVEWLLTKGVPANADISSAQPAALHGAALMRSIPIMSMLIAAGASIEALDPDGYTALELALGLYKNNTATSTEILDAASLLLLNGAEANKYGTNGDSLLLRALAAGLNRQIIDQLIAHGADVNARNTACSQSLTPLYFAAAQGWTDMVSTLLAGKAVVDAAVHGDTAYSIAYQHGHFKACNLLQQAGANQKRRGSGALAPCMSHCPSRYMLMPLHTELGEHLWR